MRVKKEAPFASETDLCAHFLADIGNAWTAYAETAGWDILLVRKADGFQIGVEAKLKLNNAVISQALEDSSTYSVTSPGPDCRAVLVPSSEANGLDRIAAYIGITIIRVTKRDERYSIGPRFWPVLPKVSDRYTSAEWREWAPTKRHELPEYVPDVAAGASAPIQLTEWKIAALKIEATIEKRGFVTRADFKHLGIDHRRWIAAEQHWLTTTPSGYIAGSHFPNFKNQHPRVYAEIVADFDKWSSPTLLKATA